MLCAADNHNNMFTYVRKNFQIQTLIKQLFTKYQILTKFHMFTKIVFLSIIGTF